MKGKIKKFIIPFIIGVSVISVGVYKYTQSDSVKKYVEDNKNYSDVRLELISEMERLKDEQKVLKRKLDEEKDEKLKKALMIKIKAIEERILEIKKQLENFNNGITSVG